MGQCCIGRGLVTWPAQIYKSGLRRPLHCTRYIQHCNMYKIAFVVCFAAFVKADADADATLLYGAYGYGGYAAAPYAGLYGGYAAPYAYSYAAGYGVPAVAGGYAGAGRYVANSAGVVHVAKRSADAEPE